MSSNTPVFVSFYTLDPYYKKYADLLINRINELNTASATKFAWDFKVYLKQAGESWSKVTFAKPRYIREWLDKYKEIIWIDIDSTLHRLPTLEADKVLNSPYDLAAVDRGSGVVVDYLWYVRSTPTTKAFFEEISKTIESHYVKNEDFKVREGGDHDAVLKVLTRYRELLGSKFGLLGNEDFGRSNGWATYGISGNEPKHNRIAKLDGGFGPKGRAAVLHKLMRDKHRKGGHH